MTHDAILSVVCRALAVSVDEVMGIGRHPRVVIARSLAFDNIRRRTWMSYPEIARVTGRPNHSTVKTSLGRLRALSDERLFDRFKPWDRLPDWTPTMTFGDLAKTIDAKITEAIGECHGQGEMPMNTSTQWKIRAMRVEEERQKAKETGNAGSALASEASQPVTSTPKAKTPLIESTAVLVRCPKCGLRQLARTDIQDAKGRYRWECRRFDPVCGWVVWGRA